MPNSDPGFVVGFGFNLFQVMVLILILLKGGGIPFWVKNNLMMVVSIPFAMLLPFACDYFQTEQDKYRAFVVMLLILGALNAF